MPPLLLMLLLAVSASLPLLETLALPFRPLLPPAVMLLRLPFMSRPPWLPFRPLLLALPFKPWELLAAVMLLRLPFMSRLPGKPPLVAAPFGLLPLLPASPLLLLLLPLGACAAAW